MQQITIDNRGTLFTSVETSTHDQTFPQFSKLPAELRCEIWTKALEQRQRILKIYLRCRLSKLGHNDNDDKSEDKEPFEVVARGYHTISKIFRVTRESRAMARLFYRVRLHASLMNRCGEEKPGVLYLNPDFDFLSPCGGPCTHGGHVVEFLHQMRAMHDPRGIGATNLAVSLADLSHDGVGFRDARPRMFAPDVAEGFAATLAQLREVWFVQTQTVGRQVFGRRSGAREDGCRRSVGFPPMGVWVPAFERLGPDPRPVDGDLERVFVWDDPREMVQAWAQLLDTWLSAEDEEGTGEKRSCHAEQRVLLTTAFAGEEIYDEEDAETWLAKERQEWKEETEDNEEGTQTPLVDSAEGVTTAVGFWLFPTPAFGPLPKSPHDVMSLRPRRYVNTRAFRPDLAVQSLRPRGDGSRG